MADDNCLKIEMKSDTQRCGISKESKIRPWPTEKAKGTGCVRLDDPMPGKMRRRAESTRRGDKEWDSKEQASKMLCFVSAD